MIIGAAPRGASSLGRSAGQELGRELRQLRIPDSAEFGNLRTVDGRSRRRTGCNSLHEIDKQTVS